MKMPAYLPLLLNLKSLSVQVKSELAVSYFLIIWRSLLHSFNFDSLSFNIQLSIRLICYRRFHSEFLLLILL